MAEKKQFPLRIDKAVYQAIEQWAADEFRSVNAHIEFLLRQALRQAGRLPRRRTGLAAETGAGENEDTAKGG